jgi:hypothetical protein
VFARKYLERARGRVTTRAGASHDDDRGDDDACVARVKGSISTRARDAATPRRDATRRIASRPFSPFAGYDWGINPRERPRATRVTTSSARERRAR